MAGIKGVKSGAMSRLKGLTEQDLFKMKKQDMIDLLVSTSKTVTANVRRLKESKYSELSPFLLQRGNNKYPLPREIKRKVAQKMGVEQLKQELRDLAYTARLETSTISGVRKYVKKFKEKTGKDLTELSSEDWERIRQKIEEGYGSTSALKAYDEETGEFPDLDEIEASEEEAKQQADNDLSNKELFEALK